MHPGRKTQPCRCPSFITDAQGTTGQEGLTLRLSLSIVPDENDGRGKTLGGGIRAIIKVKRPARHPRELLRSASVRKLALRAVNGEVDAKLPAKPGEGKKGGGEEGKGLVIRRGRGIGSSREP